MRGVLTLIAVLAWGCAPDQGVGGRDTGGDTGPDRADVAGDAPPACRPDDCASRCAGIGYPSGTCTPEGVCSCSGGDGGTPGSAGERCDDGLDNNGNGAVDEGCGCMLGTTQPCYAGSRETRGEGPCRDGTQPCTGGGEFAHWGECTGQTLPAPEECDGVDNDCDRVVDEGCPGACTPIEFGAETVCDDGIDNECDGAADCWDPDCPPCCGDEICGDGMDNDCDTVADEDCGGPCAPTEFGFWGTCTDGVDNDCDGRLDCDDIDCLIICCTVPENCGDAADNDCDGRLDCDDSDCCADPACGDSVACGSVCCVPGTSRWCDTPSYCSWGLQECQPDGRWGYCAETARRPPGCDDGGYYYSASCCVSSGECCQNFGYDSGLPSDASVGDCEGISTSCT